MLGVSYSALKVYGAAGVFFLSNQKMFMEWEAVWSSNLQFLQEEQTFSLFNNVLQLHC